MSHHQGRAVTARTMQATSSHPAHLQYRTLNIKPSARENFAIIGLRQRESCLLLKKGDMSASGDSRIGYDQVRIGEVFLIRAEDHSRMGIQIQLREKFQTTDHQAMLGEMLADYVDPDGICRRVQVGQNEDSIFLIGVFDDD